MFALTLFASRFSGLNLFIGAPPSFLLQRFSFSNFTLGLGFGFSVLLGFGSSPGLNRG